MAKHCFSLDKTMLSIQQKHYLFLGSIIKASKRSPKFTSASAVRTREDGGNSVHPSLPR